MPWNETVEEYLNTLRNSTARQYQLALNDFHDWYVGTYPEDLEPELLTDEELRDWRSYLTGVRKLAASTVNVRLSAVKGLVRHCGRKLETEGVKRVDPPIKPLTARELGRLMAAIESHQWGPLWLPPRNLAMAGMMARAGLRVGEVAALDVRDVELNARSGQALVRQGKGLKEREVPLSLQARKRIQAYLDVRPKWGGEPLFLVVFTDEPFCSSLGSVQKPSFLDSFSTRFTEHFCSELFTTCGSLYTIYRSKITNFRLTTGVFILLFAFQGLKLALDGFH